MAEEVGLYNLKKVSFKGKELPIIMQNENGPCPLIAICTYPHLVSPFVGSKLFSSELIFSSLQVIYSYFKEKSSFTPITQW